MSKRKAKVTAKQIDAAMTQLDDLKKLVVQLHVEDILAFTQAGVTYRDLKEKIDNAQMEEETLLRAKSTLEYYKTQVMGMPSASKLTIGGKK